MVTVINNNNPIVSIIIPVYNVELYLDQCIQSVINQSWRNLDIILVNDGSTDASAQICDTYAKKDSRISVIHKCNGGLSDARNTGFGKAKGKYVYFIDSDDFIDTNTIDCLVTAAINTKADLVFFDSVVNSESESDTYLPDFYIRKGLYSNPMVGYKMAKELISQKEFFTSVPMLFIKKELLDNTGLIFMNGILHEDELFTFQLFMKSQCAVHVSVPFYHRRVREFSIMSAKATLKNYYSLKAIYSVLGEQYSSETNDEKKALLRIQQEHIFLVLYKKYSILSIYDRIKVGKDFYLFRQKLKGENWIDSVAVRRRCQYFYLYSFLTNMIARDIAEKIICFRNRFRLRKKYECILKRIKGRNLNEKRILLVGVPTHGNLGDHAIAEAEVRFLRDRFSSFDIIEIPTQAYGCHSTQIQKHCKNYDIILISGGGWLGDLWLHNEKIVRDIVRRFRQNPIIIMPQTVYFSDTVQGREELQKSKKVFYQHKNLTLFVRDKKSYNFVVDTGYIKNVVYVPDMALYGFLDQVPRGQRRGCLLCFRKDREKKQKTYDVIQLAHSLASNSVDVKWTTTVYLDDINPSSRKFRLYQKLCEYVSAEFVITDRLHSMIFAALTGTPCIAVDNLTQKVSGVHEWISDLTYIRVVQSIEDILPVIDNIGIDDSHIFPSTLLSELFLKIENVIKEKSGVV